MTASIANGFGHILYQPDSDSATWQPYAFHPEYSTGNPRGNTWSAHTYNVAYSDEIGHFENCLDARRRLQLRRVRGRRARRCTRRAMTFCVPAADSLLVKINGCFLDDGDFDGPSYQQRLARDGPEPRPQDATVPPDRR